MPALITHYAFGLEVLARMGEAFFRDPEARCVFLLGNQGPDPFFYAFLTTKRSQMHRIGNLMQDVAIDASLDAFRDGIRQASREQRVLLNAYFCGYLCHFVLDRTLHPFVDAQAMSGCALGEKEDEHGRGESKHGYTHAQIEADLDALVLRRMVEWQHDGIESRQGPYRFIKDLLVTSPASLALTSALYSKVVKKAHNELLSPKSFSRCVKDMRCITGLLYSSKRGKRTLFAGIERYMFTGSFTSATKQQIKADEASCIFTNSKHASWVHPYTNMTSNESFDALFARAQAEACETIRLHQDGADSSQLSQSLDFSGQPCVL